MTDKRWFCLALSVVAILISTQVAGAMDVREEMGERAFWNGLRLFTRRHFGKSVVTSDLVAAMEEANGKNLTEFFAKWVYLK